MKPQDNIMYEGNVYTLELVGIADYTLLFKLLNQDETKIFSCDIPLILGKNDEGEALSLIEQVEIGDIFKFIGKINEKNQFEAIYLSNYYKKTTLWL